MLAGRQILIVEDEVLVAMEVEQLLLDEGCDVLEFAPTVKAALEAIASFNPDAVLLDLNLDGVPTIEVAEAMNQAGIPYVVVTGYVGSDRLEPPVASAPVVRKPWRKADLLGRLTEVLVQHSGANAK